MRPDDELRQMLRDARAARRARPTPVRVWHRAIERVAATTLLVADALFGDRIMRVSRGRDRGPVAPRRESLMLIDDCRHALRRLRAQPGTALTCLAMLALAVGLSATMFAVADHMLIRPAPYRDADRLAWFGAGADRDHFGTRFNYAFLSAMRSQPAFLAVQGAIQAPATFEGAAGLESASGARVTPGLFEMLGVAPIRGRTFVPGEGREGETDPVIISESVWRRSFGADPALVGKTIRMFNVPVRVVGIMPEWFRFPFWTTKVWRPVDLGAPPADLAKASVMVYGRLAPGFTRSSASAAATTTASGLGQIKSGEHVLLRDVADRFLDPYSQTAILSLCAGVSLVFLVLCANVANLILARTTSRRVEYSVASALGASRARILREAAVENALLGLAASLAGLGLAGGLTSAALTWLPASITDRTMNPIALDLRAVLAASLIGFVAVLIAGLPPAWMGTRVNATDSLRLSSRGSTPSAAQRRWTRAMLVTEVALASTLLIGAGLLATSFVRLMQADPGFDPRGVVTATLSLPAFNFKDAASRMGVGDAVQRGVASMPGVRAASLSFGLPPSGGGFFMGGLTADTGRRVEKTLVFDEQVGPGFFSVFGIRILEGRDFTPADGSDAVVVGRHLATMLWPDGSAVGRAFTLEDEKAPMHVIGVAQEVLSVLLDPTHDEPEYYRRLSAGGSTVMLGIRCAGACPSEAALRARLHDVEPRAVVTSIGSPEVTYLAQFEKPRAAAALAMGFAVVALLAAGGGLFSVMTYAVGRRRREFGVRIALGAEPARLMRLILADGLVVAATGLALGSVGAIALGRWLSSLAYGVTLATPVVWLAVTSAVVVATIGASWRPARAAAQADPSELLRDS